MSEGRACPAVNFQDIYIRVAPKKIALLKFIIEGYDGLAQVTTVDRHSGLVKLVVPLTRTGEIWRLLENISSLCQPKSMPGKTLTI
ncbi:MAG: DUF4911 domain-containing protein [Desulfobulbaceae bacterium]|nr:DUF4911 domain-containing protein [Desulfobulbaceae bacterium]